MKLLRGLLGLVVGAYALYNLIPILSTAAFKSGLWAHPDGDAERMIPLWQATPWWQLGLWAMIVATTLWAAARLLGDRPAFALAGAAFAADAVLWWVMHAMPAYQQAFTDAELAADYYTFAGMLAALVAIWLIERPRGGAAPI